MALHSTRRGGRGSRSSAEPAEEIVGNVILKGKGSLWGQANRHYHHQMQAGENTLNAHCARLIMRSLIATGKRYDPARFLDDYIAFMTADAPQHPDTYAESYHRAFFANLVRGIPKTKCGGVTHDTPSIGGLVTIAPIVLALRLVDTPLREVLSLCREHLYLTHPDEHLARVCAAYVELLDGLLFRPAAQSPRELIVRAAASVPSLNLKALHDRARSDREVVGNRFSTACYITDSWPSVLFLAYRYIDDPLQGLLANTNLGGDNVHRGAVLGSIFGLASGAAPVALFDQLRDRSAIDEEIHSLVSPGDR